MPTYEYVCKQCGEHVEVVQSFRDEPLTVCANCGGPLRKVFGSIGISFKGSGFYRTDSRPARSESRGSGDGSKSGSGDSGKTSGSKTSGSSGSGSSGSGSSGSGSSGSGSGSGSSGSGSSGSGASGSGSGRSSGSSGSKAEAG